MDTAWGAEEQPDEGEPLPLEEREAPVFPTMREVAVARGEGWAQDLAWHDDMQAGMPCPRCVVPRLPSTRGRVKKLKRHKSTVYCEFCRVRWWSKRPM